MTADPIKRWGKKILAEVLGGGGGGVLKLPKGRESSDVEGSKLRDLKRISKQVEGFGEGKSGQLNTGAGFTPSGTAQ